jgi:acyl carrier protein
MPTLQELRTHVDQRRTLCDQLKQLLIDRLDVPMDPAWLTDDQPLFGRGLELDSVDALELVVGIEYDFGVSITDDEIGIFGSIGRLADFIEQES